MKELSFPDEEVRDLPLYHTKEGVRKESIWEEI